MDYLRNVFVPVGLSVVVGFFAYFIPSDEGERQGLTLVHFLAQLEPCLTHENTLHTLNTP
jgi:hypothetical protein